MSLVEFHDSFTFTFNRKEKGLKSERYVIVTDQTKLDCYCPKKTVKKMEIDRFLDQRFVESRG